TRNGNAKRVSTQPSTRSSDERSFARRFADGGLPDAISGRSRPAGRLATLGGAFGSTAVVLVLALQDVIGWLPAFGDALAVVIVIATRAGIDRTPPAVIAACGDA